MSNIDISIDISICPTSLDINDGSRLVAARLIEATRRQVAADYPGATISVQIGYRQGDEWARIDGQDDDTLAQIAAVDISDEDLYE